MSHSRASGTHRRLSGGSSGDARVWRELGLDALIAGEPAAGLWFLRNAVEIQPDDPPTWQLMGRCFEAMGEEPRAKSCYLLALQQHAQTDPNDASPPVAPLALSWRRGPTCDV